MRRRLLELCSGIAVTYQEQTLVLRLQQENRGDLLVHQCDACILDARHVDEFTFKICRKRVETVLMVYYILVKDVVSHYNS